MAIDFQDLVLQARKEGRRLLIFDLGSQPLIASTESVKEIGNLIGEALAVSAKILHQATRGQITNFTEEDALKAIVASAVKRAAIVTKVEQEVLKRSSA